MKARRIVYLVIGIFLVVVNLLVDLINFKELYLQSDDAAYTLGSLLGGHFLMIAGLFLLRASYKLGKRIKLLDTMSLEMDVESIGKSNN